MNRHTPGPWELKEWGEKHPDSFSVDAHVTEFPSAVVTVHPNPYLEADGKVARANARLIAAAPELLEALAPLAALMTVIPDDTQIIHRDDAPLYGFDNVTITYGDVRRAAAAIAKALGT